MANTNEVLYLVNRPGSRPSSDGAAEWMDLAIDRVTPVFKKVWLRGDTDFSLTHNFDRWDERVGTNDRKMTAQEIVLFANDRCNQENVIGQLKSGVNALRMPSDGLVSNWAYMVIAALAWNLKAWYGLVTLEPAARRDILRMEFKRFLGSFIQIPCQIVATGRRLVYRILTYSRHLETFLETFDPIRQLKFA